MKKATLLGIGLLLVVAFSLCFGTFAAGKTGALEDTLVVTATTGSDLSWAEAVAPNFEKFIKEKYGKQVKVITNGTQIPALWAKFKTEWPNPSSDVYTFYTDMVVEGINKGYWEKLSPYFSSKDIKGLGKERVMKYQGYGIPYDSMYWGPVVRKDLVPFNLTSWNDLGDPRLKNRMTFDSAVKVGSGYIAVQAAGLVLKQDWTKWRKADGTLNKQAITPALRLVRKWYQNALTLTEGSGTIRPLLQRGESLASCWWSYQTLAEKASGQNVEFVFLKEGALAANGTACIMVPTRASHKNLAIEWIKYLYSKEGYQAAYDAKIYGNLAPRTDMELPEIEKTLQPPKNLKVYESTDFRTWASGDAVRADFLNLYTQIVIQGM